MSVKVLPWIGGIVVWAALLFGALSMAVMPLDWGHSVCGIWGCGPPTHVLAACHLSWLVILTPLSALVATRFSAPTVVRTAFFLVAGSVAVMLSFLAYEAITWLPQSNSFQAGFFWRRWLFVMVTMVDVPVFETLLLGLILIAPALLRNKRGARRAYSQSSQVDTEQSQKTFDAGIHENGRRDIIHDAVD